MTTVKTWLASAALVGGAGGGALAGLSAVDGNAPASAAAPPAVAAPDTAALQGQIDALLREDGALKLAVHRARQRLAGQVHAGERSLAALHRRILEAQNELARAQSQTTRARASALMVVTVPAPAPVSTPTAHATTGASGASGASGDDAGEQEGGGDD